MYLEDYGLKDTFSLSSSSNDKLYYCASTSPELMERTQNRHGFLYYNDLAKDIPIVFDSGATIIVTPNQGIGKAILRHTSNFYWVAWYKFKAGKKLYNLQHSL